MEIKTALENVNLALKSSSDNQLHQIMGDTAIQYNSQLKSLSEACETMECRYEKLAEYFTFDHEKYQMEDFFNDIKIFKQDFAQAHKKCV